MPLINWYPGHIAKAQNRLKEQLKLIDVVLELVDARLPETSRFDVTRRLLGDKPSILVFTKTDMANPELTRAWMQAYEQRGLQVVAVNAQTGDNLQSLKRSLEKVKQVIDQRMRERGRLPRPIRVMVVGLPNVGKSSLINKLTGKRIAQVGDKPGITRDLRWIRIATGIELMDTPGIIPPKLDQETVALKLAITGAVSTEAYEPEEVAEAAIALLAMRGQDVLKTLGGTTLESIARHRGYLAIGGEADIPRTARTILKECRGGQVGPLTWDDGPQAS